MILDERIIEAYEAELLKRRRKEQVRDKMRNPKIPHFAHRAAQNLERWGLKYAVKDFVAAQFFALDYMPYLPTMIHIASDKALERYNKVKHFFKQKTSREKAMKVIRKIAKKKVDEDYYLDLINVIETEESEKRIDYNKISGFAICLETTTLYNPKSSLCKSCSFKIECAKTLKKRNPGLYKYRKGIISKRTYLNYIRKV